MSEGVPIIKVGWRRRVHRCDQCGAPAPPMFILHDALWISIAERRAVLCLHCAQARLGRRILPADLKPGCGITEDLLLGMEILTNVWRNLYGESCRSPGDGTEGNDDS